MQTGPLGSHPEGESSSSIQVCPSAGVAVQPGRLALDLHGKRVYVEWDPQAPVTPLGQLVYFSQFLATAGLYRDWVETCPVRYTSPNAPDLNEVLGTITLSILAGTGVMRT